MRRRDWPSDWVAAVCSTPVYEVRAPYRKLPATGNQHDVETPFGLDRSEKRCLAMRLDDYVDYWHSDDGSVYLHSIYRRP
jgi:hypothetical protein